MPSLVIFCDSEILPHSLILWQQAFINLQMQRQQQVKCPMIKWSTTYLPKGNNLVTRLASGHAFSNGLHHARGLVPKDAWIHARRVDTS